MFTLRWDILSHLDALITPSVIADFTGFFDIKAVIIPQITDSVFREHKRLVIALPADRASSSRMSFFHPFLREEIGTNGEFVHASKNVLVFFIRKTSFEIFGPSLSRDHKYSEAI